MSNTPSIANLQKVLDEILSQIQDLSSRMEINETHVRNLASQTVRNDWGVLKQPMLGAYGCPLPNYQGQPQASFQQGVGPFGMGAPGYPSSSPMSAIIKGVVVKKLMADERFKYLPTFVKEALSKHNYMGHNYTDHENQVSDSLEIPLTTEVFETIKGVWRMTNEEFLEHFGQESVLIFNSHLKRHGWL